MDNIIMRELNEDDIYTLMNLINNVNFNNKNSYYLSPIMSMDTLNDLFIRSGLFDYSTFGYGKFNHNKLESVILFSIPIHITFLRSASLHFANCEHDKIDKKLLSLSIASLKDNYPDIMKIKIIANELKDESFIRSIINDGFSKELELKNDIDIGNYLWFAKFI